MKRLMTHSFRLYFILSGFTLAVSIPFFYFVIQHLLISKMDNELLEHKAEFTEFGSHITAPREVDLFKLFNKEFAFAPTQTLLQKDSLFTEYRFDSLERKAEPFRILRTGVVLHGQPYVLEVKESLITTQELLVTIVLLKAGILASLLIGLLIVNRRITKRIWAPFYKVLHVLKTFEIESDKAIDLTRSDIREFHDLNVEIHNLMDRIRRSYFAQKEFIENASHELQTPIAVCRSKLELLLQMKELTRDQAELIERLYEATDSIIKLNRNLLLLAKIENRQYPEVQRINVHELLTHILDDIEDRLAEKELRIGIVGSKNLVLSANRELMGVMLTNLVSNAIRYSEPASEINIRLQPGELVIANTGRPLTSPEKIFQRFHRESKTSPGHGLGLAIVKMICDVNGYAIRYFYENGQHHFQLIFDRLKSNSNV